MATTMATTADPGLALPPPEARTDAARTFAEPWEARAFAVALAASERGLFSLGDFQTALIARVAAHETAGCIASEADYYTRWIEALEDLLAARGLLAGDRIAALEAEVTADAASRKAHQHRSARDAEGRLRIAPLTVDPAPAARG